MRPSYRLLYTIWQHPWQNWGLLLYAGVLTVCIRAGLSTYSLSRVVQGLRHLAKRLPQRSSATQRYRMRAAWAAHAVGRRLLPKRPCLTQALVLQYLLLRRGDDAAELHIGVSKTKKKGLQAHAWIERNGKVLIGGTGSPHEYERFQDFRRKLSSEA